SNAAGSPIVLQADRMALGVGTITANGGGRVTLRALTAGRLVDLGSVTDAAANTLELSNAELNTITTTGVLQIGTGAEGNTTIPAPLSVGAGTLSLLNSGSITEAAGGTLTTANLRLSTPGPVTMNNNNSVGTLAAALTGAGTAFSFNNAGNLQIANVDGVS